MLQLCAVSSRHQISNVEKQVVNYTHLGNKGEDLFLFFFFSNFRKMGFKNVGTAAENLRVSVWQNNVGRSGITSSFPGEESEKQLRDSGKSAAESGNALRCLALSFWLGLCSALVQCEGEKWFWYFQALFTAANARNPQWNDWHMVFLLYFPTLRVLRRFRQLSGFLWSLN